MKLSVVILAKTDSEDLFQMTSTCINSLLTSEKKNIAIEIIIIESNKNYKNDTFQYPEFVTVIVPESNFNFHQFLNIGIKASTGDYIGLCNNDLIFQPNWFSEIYKIGKQNPDILSFSPTGKSPLPDLKETFEIGYKVMTHIKGWCIVAKKELFQKIGLLDETFNFYFADNDFAMTLKSKNIKHALVFNSYVIHLEKKSTSITDKATPLDKTFLSKYNIPKYLLDHQYQWVLESENNLSGFLKFHEKWGSPNFLYKKNKLADLLIKYNMGFCIPLFFKIKF